MTDDFTGRVVFVTGAASGIGLATAELFAKKGASVMVADLGEDRCADAAKRIRAAGGEADYVEVDVSDAQQVEAAITTTVERYGGLHCAYNNAGIAGESAPTADCSLENWRRTIEVNLGGVFNCMKYELPHLIESKGAIVNCASIAGIVAFAGSPAYGASKGGIIELTKVAAIEYAEAGVRVNAVCPGVIETPMVEQVMTDETMAAALKAGEPIGRLGQPIEIAEAVVWLCSDAASFVTGHPMVVDGGWIAR